jgi:hypothetical protein
MSTGKPDKGGPKIKLMLMRTEEKHKHSPLFYFLVSIANEEESSFNQNVPKYNNLRQTVFSRSKFIPS